jgi:Tfp pilus assembly protein FimT
MMNGISLSKGSVIGSRQAGYSVIELTIVVMIAMIIGSMSLVGFRKARTNYELTQNAQKLVWQIERARSLAIKYNQTLTLGFTSSDTEFGLTCTNCTQAKYELSSLRLPTRITLSAYPSLSIKGNGTISSTSGTVVVTDGQGYQVPITISNSGRTTIGEVSKTNSTY